MVKIEMVVDTTKFKKGNALNAHRHSLGWSVKQADKTLLKMGFNSIVLKHQAKEI